MPIKVKRAHHPAAPEDGHRVLVDRLWPRGLSKEHVAASEWLRDVAPSDGLRKSYHAGDLSWAAFRRAYLAELKGHRRPLRRLAEMSRDNQVTLLFGARNEQRNNAVVLQQYLRMLGAC